MPTQAFAPDGSNSLNLIQQVALNAQGKLLLGHLDPYVRIYGHKNFSNMVKRFSRDFKLKIAFMCRHRTVLKAVFNF